jgi:hypothetical protein
VKHMILQYIKGTLDLGIFYKRDFSTSLTGFVGSSGPWSITGFTDADWAACKDTRRSVGGYIFTMAAGPITWSSKRQQTVSRSSTESEYHSRTEPKKLSIFRGFFLSYVVLSTLQSNYSILKILSLQTSRTQLLLHQLILNCSVTTLEQSN